MNVKHLTPSETDQLKLFLKSQDKTSDLDLHLNLDQIVKESGVNPNDKNVTFNDIHSINSNSCGGLGNIYKLNYDDDIESINSKANIEKIKEK